MKEMTSDELKLRLEAGDAVRILDIREAEEFDDWHIFNSVNVPMMEAISEGDYGAIDDRVKDFPTDQPVAVICRSGNTSRVAAARMEALGFDAANLLGGIHGWSAVWTEAKVTVEADWSLIQIRRNGKGCLSYIIASDGKAAVVDPCVDASVFTTIAKREKLTITDVIETHVHADHVSRARALCETTGASLRIGKNDRVEFEYNAIEDGQELTVGSVTVRAITTPGHTRESVCFNVGSKVLLSGDTVFTDAIGRPDLERGDAGAAEGAGLLYESLRKKILPFEDDMVICPGHTADPIGFDGVALCAPLSEVRTHIEPMVTADKADFVETVVGLLGPKPPNFQRVVSVNEGKMDLAWLDPLELEAGPNRCAVKNP